MFSVELHTVLFFKYAGIAAVRILHDSHRSPLAVTGRDEVIMSHSGQVFLHAHILSVVQSDINDI